MCNGGEGIASLCFMWFGFKYDTRSHIRATGLFAVVFTRFYFMYRMPLYVASITMSPRPLMPVQREGDFEELKPLTARWVTARGLTDHSDDGRYPAPMRGPFPSVSSGGIDFIRRQTIPRRGATTKKIALNRQGNWINE